MSYTVDTLVSCQNVQTALDETFFGAASAQFLESNPFLDFIVSERNQSGLLQEAVMAGGKLKGVTVTYFQRLLESDEDFGGTNANSCSGGGNLTENFYTYDLDENQGDSIDKTITISELNYGCQRDEFYVGKLLQNMMNGLERKINTDVISQAAGLVGNFSSTGTSTAINTDAKNSDKAWVTDLIEDVDFEMMDNEYQSGDIIAIGGSKLWSQYWSAIGAACCIDKKGIDQGQLAAGTRIMPIYDRKVNSGLGTDKFFATAPGAMQLLQYNRYGHSIYSDIDTATEKYGTIVSPYSGISYDYNAKLTCETWRFYIGLTYDLVAAPDDMYASGDRMSGVNLINQFTAVDQSA